MRAPDISLALAYSLAGTAGAALALSPLPRAYPLLVAGAGALGLFWDTGRRHFIPRIFLTLLGLAGFAFSLLPLSRETLAEQSLAALTVLLAVKLLEKKERRDHLQVLALAVIMVAGGASLSPDLAYAPLFLLDLVLGSLLLIWLPFADQIGRGTVPRDLLRRLGAISGLLGCAAVPFSLAIFIILPRALNPFWSGLGTASKAVSGFSDQLRLGAVGKISLSRDVAFRAEMEEPAGPLPLVPYWRGIVLEVTDGRQWWVSRSLETFAYPASGTTVRATYYVEPHGALELFLLEQPVSAVLALRIMPLDGAKVLRLSRPLLKPARYLGFSYAADSRPGPILGPERERNLRLPEGFSPRIRELATRLAGGEKDPAAAAGLLLDFFSRGFNYSLEVPPAAGDPLEDFLFVNRTGYCEYFASSLAVMLRCLGIPARLVAGYLGGEFNDAGNYYLVRQAAAHTWVEAYFPGRGWVRLDPTPGSELGTTLASRRLRRSFLWLDSLRLRWNSWVVQYDTQAQITLFRRTRRDLGAIFGARPSPAHLWFLGILTASLAAFGIRQRLMRWPADPLQERHRRFGRLLERRGFPRPAHEGPLDFAGRVARSWPGAGDEVMGFSSLYVRLRYGGSPVTGEELKRLDGFLEALFRLRPPPGTG